jgi:hypothetical protein
MVVAEFVCYGDDDADGDFKDVVAGEFGNEL